MTNTTKSIPLFKLVPHPANPNAMSEPTFRKLVRNIERTGLYEPIVVRPHPQQQDCFEIINGHHRAKALAKLGRKEADCVVWDIDDEQTSVLLMTLNRLCGSDEPAKKIALLKELTERMKPTELAKILPSSAKQIEQLINLKLSDCPAMPSAEQFAIPLVFFVTKQQQGIIEKAISSIEYPASSNKTTKAQRRAEAIVKIADSFLRIEKCQTTNV